MIALSPTEGWDYQLKEDRTKEGGLDESKPVFRLGALTPEDEAHIENLTVELIGQGQRVNYGSIKLETLRRGLRGWRNLTDKAGAAVKFQANGSGRPSDESIARIPLKQRTELVNAITERNTVSVAEQDSPKPSPT